MKKTYENGYLPKIAYHLAAGNEDKFLYFSEKQVEVYGPFNTFEEALDREDEINLEAGIY